MISVRAELDPAVVRTVEVQLIAAARPVRRISIDRGGYAHVFQPCGYALWIVVVDAEEVADLELGRGAVRPLRAAQAEVDHLVPARRQAQPEPDMFHDVYGHLPYFTLPEYAEIQQLFAPAFHKATSDDQRENIKRLAWFSTEFGLIREGGELKIFGTGLISSSAEMEHVLAGNTPLMDFKVETIVNFDKAIWSFNNQLFVFESLEALAAELGRYFQTL